MARKIKSQDDYLIESLVKFYSKKTNLKKFTETLDNKEISLRLLEWFPTKYCSNEDVSINNVNVYESYKDNLKSYCKKKFDPFCRGKRIKLTLKNDKIISHKYTTTKCCNSTNEIVTTVGQLNYFKWCITLNIIGYVKKNLKKIQDYIKKNGKKTKTKNPKIKKIKKVKLTFS